MRYRGGGEATAGMGERGPDGRRRRFATRALSAVLATLTFWTPVLARADADPEVPADEPERQSVDRQAWEEVQAEQNDPLPEHLRGHEEELRDWRAELPAQGSGDSPSTQPDPSTTPIDLPGGREASAATPQAISLPDAEGSVEGMGESFSPVLSSGTATFHVPIAVAPGRAGVKPSLALSYSSSNGNGPVGFGWSFGVPFISRQADRGLPRYIDGSSWHEEEDRFIYNGGQELVPVDSGIATVDQAAMHAGDVYGLPSDVSGWQQYRARVEGGFMRFFRSPDSKRWIVQSKEGTRFDFGLLSDGPPEAISASQDALESDPEATTGGVYRWRLTRMSDRHGSTVYYVYDQDGGRGQQPNLTRGDPRKRPAMRRGGALERRPRRPDCATTGRCGSSSSSEGGRFASSPAHGRRRAEAADCADASGRRGALCVAQLGGSAQRTPWRRRMWSVPAGQRRSRSPPNHRVRHHSWCSWNSRRSRFRSSSVSLSPPAASRGSRPWRGS